MPRLPRPLVLVLWLCAAALLVRTVGRDRGVIIDHIEFGRRVAAGEDPYRTFATETRNEGPLHRPYPPSFGVFTAPLALLPEGAARAAWGVLQLIALWGLGWALLWWQQAALPAPAWAAPHWTLVAGVALLSRYVLRDTHGGGGNGINTALAFCGFTLAEARRPARAGLLLGLSIATKPTQVLFVLLLALFRRWHALGWTCLVAGAMAAVAWARVGSGPWIEWIEGSLAYGAAVDIYAPPSHGFPPFTWMNQCLRCMVYRALATTPPEFAREIEGFRQGLGWSLDAVAGIARAANLAVLGTVAALAWRGRRDASGRVLAAALLLTASLLLSPISWKAHHVALAPAVFLTLHLGSRRIWALLALYIPTCVVGEAFLGKELKNELQAWYLVTVWDLVLVALLGWQIARIARQRSANGPSGYRMRRE